MINVYQPNTTIFTNNGLATLIPISATFDIGINGSWQLTIEHPFDEELRFQYLVKDAVLRVTDLDCVREFDNSTQLFRIYDVKRNLSSVTVIAFPIALEAVYDAPIESLTIENKTGIQAGSTLNGISAKYTVTSDVSASGSSEYENTNLIKAISGSDDESFVNVWGGEVAYDNYNIKIKSKLGDQSNIDKYLVAYGRNLTGFEYEEDMSSVVTRIYPISSDDMRLNGWQDVTSQGGNSYVDSSNISNYPFIRSTFVETDYSLVDTKSDSVSETATATANWMTGMITKVTTEATTLWNSVVNDLTHVRNAEYIKTLLSDIIKYCQNRVSFTNASWQSLVKSAFKQGMEWIKNDELPTWEWHEDTSVEPYAWWYGDNSVTPAVSYAKNEYVKIGKRYEWFGDDGYWRDYKYAPSMDWYEDQNGHKMFGYREGYYAHNEYVYMTVSGVMKEWWYDEEGWYDDSKSGDSDMDWHGDSSTGYWFGEADATSEDTNKFLHDRWAFIDGNYYWFDQYGYISGDAETTRTDYPWGNQSTVDGDWFGNDADRDLGSLWVKSQWLKIDGEWYYFDSNGYVVDMQEMESNTIAWFANAVYNASINTVKTYLTQAYTLLYRLMTEWCNKQYTSIGVDKPTVNVSVDLIDLRKTVEYKDFQDLETIALGNKVRVVDRWGNQYEERVVGLTYDCLRKCNTFVEVGMLSKTVAQLISVNYSGAQQGQKLIAGDNVTINGKVISVGDYVGRVVGLQDVLVNNSSIVNGNVATLDLVPGDNITISRSGNTLTINGEGGGLEYWTETSSNIYQKQVTPITSALGWECDENYYIDTQVQWVFNSGTWGQKINSNPCCGAICTINDKWCPVFISSVQDDSTYHVVFVHNFVSQLYDIDGVDFYCVPIPDGQMVRGYCGTRTERPQLEINNGALIDIGEYSNYGDAIDALVEIAHFSTKIVNYSGIANDEDYIFWGGEKNTTGSDNLSPSDMPFNVSKSGIVKAKDYRVDGVSIDKVRDVRVDGSSVVSDKVANIVLAGKQDALTEGDNIDIINNVISAVNTDALADLTDVDLNSLTDGQVLKYNSTSSKWENANESGGSGGETILADSAIDESRLLFTSGEVTAFNQTAVTYTATEDCYALCKFKGSSQGTDMLPLVNGTMVRLATTTDMLSAVLPLRKGDVISNRYISDFSESCYFRMWIYARKPASLISAPIIYSEDERQVGVWINNKPLYQRTLSFDNVTIPANEVINKDLSQYISALDKAIFHKTMIMLVSGNWFELPSLHANTTYYAYGISAALGSNTLTVSRGSAGNITGDIKTTIWYTKTTDVAGSGSYTTLGVPTVHYSTDEQVIGTWIDGSTLYQQTVTTGGTVPSGATLVERIEQVGYDTIKYTKTT